MKKTMLKKLGAVLTASLLMGCASDDESVTAISAPVNEVPVDMGLVFNKTKLNFETPDLTETLSVAGYENSALNWTVDSPYICSVDGGKVTALSGGTAIVKAVLKADSSKFATCSVTIAEPSRAVTSDPFDAKALTEGFDLICCGDSIMRDYGAADADQYGLGQALKGFFDLTKVNLKTDIANGGRSSRYFYNEPSRWAAVKEILQANKTSGKKTVVLFSFGHNDQRSLSGSDSNVGPYGASFTFASENQNSTVAGTFYDYMERYIVETRELGGVPVMVSPFVRADFSGSSVSQKGRHNMTSPLAGESKPRGDYPAAMKAVAKKHNAIFVDMTSLSAAVVEEYNSKGKIKYFYVDSDNTHERTLGGLELARLVTQDLKTQGYFTSYIKDVTPRIMVNSSSLAFGRLLEGASKTLSFKLSNFQNKSGSVSLKVPEGYGLSLSNTGSYNSTLDIPTGPDFIGTEVFVKFTPSQVISYNGDLEVSHTSVTPDFGNTPAGEIAGSTLKISLTGAGKEKNVEGSDVSVIWKMIDSNKYSDLPNSTSDDLAPNSAELKGLISTTHKNGVARVLIAGGTWPVNDTGAKLDDVYIEYSIPAVALNLTVNKISFDAASSGGSYMRWSAYYSTNKDFINPDPICVIAGEGQTKEVLANFAVGGAKGSDEALGLTVADGETLYIRIYPAYKDTKENAGRSFMIADVTVEGLIN